MNLCSRSHRLRFTGLALGACAAAPMAVAQYAPAPAAADAPAITEDTQETLLTAITGGTVKANIRARAELVEQTGTDFAQSYTVRTRLGYQTQEFNGFTGYVELEDVRAADDDLFNDGPGESSAGATRAVVADPNVTELNQAWIQYANKDLANLRVKAGRQVIVLDDHRFIGHVGWRQDNQTFDAVRGWTNFGIDGLGFTGGYISKVNRIFGEEADFDDANSLFLNGWYNLDGIGKLTAFYYLFDLGTESVAAPNSNQTFGGRLTGSQDLGDGFALNYAGSVAFQQDAGDNPVDYDAEYYDIDLSLKTPTLGTFGVGYEVLGSDGGDFGFRTPLATLHKFNGWADVFLVTPNEGLRDFHVYYGIPFPKEWKMSGQLVYHYFGGDDGVGEFGQEFDAVITKKLDSNWTLLAKLSIYDGNTAGTVGGGIAAADITKLTVDLTLAF